MPYPLLTARIEFPNLCMGIPVDEDEERVRGGDRCELSCKRCLMWDIQPFVESLNTVSESE